MEFLENEQIGKALLFIIACYVVFLSPYMAWTAWKENRKAEEEENSADDSVNK